VLPDGLPRPARKSRGRQGRPFAGRLRHSGFYPPGTTSDGVLTPEKRLSWVTLIYNDFDASQNLHFLFERSAPWDSAKNRVPTIRSFDFDVPGRETHSDYVPPGLLPYRVLLCPANAVGRNSGVTHYVGISGIGLDSPTLPKGHPRAGIFGYDRQTFVDDIKDGLATTMMLAETAEEVGPWIAGGPTTVRAVDPARKPHIGRGRPFGGTHRRGLNVAFADGSVRFIRETIDPNVFEALSTVAGGEPLAAGWDR
jgi:prepilin-type processing-associated H-X9-DG protein